VKYSLEQLYESQLPCILHWNSRHFVVVPPQEFDGKKILIADPAYALRSLEVGEFLKSWLGPNSEVSKGFVLHVAEKTTKRK
jgi:ATP-binding cassette subfamily B protein